MQLIKRQKLSIIISFITLITISCSKNSEILQPLPEHPFDNEKALGKEYFQACKEMKGTILGDLDGQLQCVLNSEKDYDVFFKRYEQLRNNKKPSDRL